MIFKDLGVVFWGVGPMSSSPWGYFSKLLVGLGADFGGGPMFPMPWLLVCLSGEAAERDLSGEAAKRGLGGGAAKRDLHMRHQPPIQMLYLLSSLCLG